MITFRIDAYDPEDDAFDVAAFGFLPGTSDEPDYCTSVSAHSLQLLIGPAAVGPAPEQLVGRLFEPDARFDEEGPVCVPPVAAQHARSLPAPRRCRNRSGRHDARTAGPGPRGAAGKHAGSTARARLAADPPKRLVDTLQQRDGSAGLYRAARRSVGKPGADPTGTGSFDQGAAQGGHTRPRDERRALTAQRRLKALSRR